MAALFGCFEPPVAQMGNIRKQTGVIYDQFYSTAFAGNQ